MRKRAVASALVATAFLAAEPAHVIIHDAYVERALERPAAASGVRAACIRIDIRTASGERFPVYQFYLSGRQSLPQAGGGCTIEYHEVAANTCETDAPANPHKTIRMADSISCSVAPM